MKKTLPIFLFLLFSCTACVKSRECECLENVSYGTDTLPDIIYINGTIKDAKKACINLADSNEVCKLK